MNEGGRMEVGEERRDMGRKVEEEEEEGGLQHVTVNSHIWRGAAVVAAGNQATSRDRACVRACTWAQLNEQLVYLAKDPGSRKDCSQEFCPHKKNKKKTPKKRVPFLKYASA